MVLPHKRLPVRLCVPFVGLLSQLEHTVRSSQSVPFEGLSLGSCLFWRKQIIFPVPPAKREKEREGGPSLELLLKMCNGVGWGRWRGVIRGNRWGRYLMTRRWSFRLDWVGCFILHRVPCNLNTTSVLLWTKQRTTRTLP